jgi:DNA-directed RNA polymerase specialized sigma24 family protein
MRHLQTGSGTSLTPESLFAAKYDWIFGWAIHFAQGDHSIAEDLVHDTFVRFALAKPDLSDVENTEALLYTYLKYVHLAYLRRLQRYPFEILSLVEFDSLQIGLRESAAVAEQIEAQDTLRRVVAYLTWRKESAKSASMLILRFFHGYYPDEIVCIARTTRQSVRNRLQEAREESAVYVADPGHLRIMHQTESPQVIPVHNALPTEELIAELQKIIFAACRTECLSETAFKKQYQAKKSTPIDRELLAHIVSCERCLELASRLCQIAPPSNRSPEDSLGADRSSRRRSKQMNSPSSSNSSISRTLRIVQDRVREVYEHQPSQLMVAVNGSVVASRDTGSPLGKLVVKLGSEMKPEFIEVVSEQGICLLTMPVISVPPDAPPEIKQVIELSQGRRIEARLQFTSVGFLVEIIYHDPLLLEAEEEGEEAKEYRRDQGSEAFRPGKIVSTGRTEREPLELAPRPSRWSRLWARIPRITVPEMSPLLASTMVFAVAMTIIGAFWLRNASKPNAADFLARAVLANPEGTKDAKPGVICQKIRIRTSKRTFDRTIYRDAQGLRHPKPQKLALQDTQLQTQLALANVNWDDPLSAVNYKVWHDEQPVANDEVKRSGDGLLTLTTAVPDGIVASESLTVRDRDFHPVERTVTFRNSETVEIAELDYSVAGWTPPSESQFEPFMTHMSTAAQSLRLPLLTNVDLDEAELQTRLVLHQLNADTDGRVQLSRKSTGIQVSGIVDSEQRKRQLETQLRSLSHVQTSLATVREMQARPAPRPGNVPLQAYPQIAQPSVLENYLVEKGWSRDKVSDLSRQLLEASVVVHREGKVISELSRRFSMDGSLSPTAKSTLAQLIASRRASLLSALQRQESLLAETGIRPESASSIPSSDETLLEASARRNRVLCEQLATGSSGSESIRPVDLVTKLQVSINQARAAVASITADQQSIHRFNAKQIGH